MIDLEFFRLKLGKVINPVLNFFRVPFLRTKKVVTDRLYLKIAMVSAITIMILFNTFSWFYSEYVGPGSLFTVGSIVSTVKQYDLDGVFIEDVGPSSTIVFEDNMGNTTVNSKFIEIKNDGTLNMDYNITFQLDGTIAEAGVMYYRLYEVTAGVEAAVIDETYDTKLKSYAHLNPIPENIESDQSHPIANMSTIDNFVRKDSIRVTGTTTDSNPRYYRLDYGMYQNANSALYSGKTISVHMSVYSTQYGQLSEDTETEQQWLILNQTEMRDAINSALPGNTLKLLQDVTVDGTLTVNKRLHINTNGHKLIVTGDLVYDFVDFGSMLITTYGGGQLEVNGNLYVNTPKTEVHILGDNTTSYDIFVGGTTTFNGIQQAEKNGILLDNVRIVSDKQTLAPENLIIMSNTRVNIGPDVIVGNITSLTGAVNIEIINEGTINQIQLQAMTLLTTFTKAQIYVYNLGTIYSSPGYSILLPSNATPYLGPNNGNTLIVKGITSSDITVSGSSNYTQEDIVYDNTDNSVVPINGVDDAYTVYIKEANRSLENILNSYFISTNEPDVPAKIAAIKRLDIHTINAQYLQGTDFDYLKSSALTTLAYLDLANARVKDGEVINRIKSEAMSGKTTLKNLFLPTTVTSIGENAFHDVELGQIPSNITDPFYFLTIPASVTSIELGAFNASKYVKFEGALVPTIADNTVFDNSNNGTHLFAIETSVANFQANANLNAANIHQLAYLSDNRTYFIFDYQDGLGIALYIGTGYLGTNIGIPSELLANGYNTSIKAIGVSSYRHVTLDAGGASLTLPTLVNRIDYGAFYGLKVTTANFANIVSIGDYAFYNNELSEVIANSATTIGSHAFENTTAETASFNSLVSLGAYAFASSSDLYEINLANVTSIGDYALYDCKQLNRVYLTNTSSKYVNNQETVDLTIGTNAFFSNWGYYSEGRLRVYVPNGVSANSNAYLTMYKTKFAGNDQFVYVTGSSVGSYYHYALPYDLTQYTVRQVTVVNHLSANVDGWEIISYQGANLNGTYTFPATLTVGATTLPVVSIGEGAFRNALATAGQSPVISSTNLITIGKNAFIGVAVTSVTTPNVVSVGDSAFNDSGLLTVTFDNLDTIGEYSFANNDSLWSANLGKVRSLGYRAVYNDSALLRLYFLNTGLDMSFASESLSSISSPRFRIYVPAVDAQIEYYKSILSYPEKIYGVGTPTGTYTVGGQNIGEYTVREVTKNNYNATPVTGWEIIEYHGADLAQGYAIPANFTVNSTTYPVISIGRDAYINADTVTDGTFSISNNNIINIGRNAFNGVEGITSLSGSGVVTIGDYAFAGTDINSASFANLNTIGDYALSNNATLYSVDLGKVKNMGLNSLYNAPYLAQVFFTATDTNLTFNTSAILDVGTETNNRLRFYVTDGNSSGGTPFVDIYRALFATEYVTYFYPMLSTVGSYTPINIPYDIGIYSVRPVTINNYAGTPTTGWELVEYHGEDLPSSYTLPTNVTVGSTTYPVISIGKYAFAHTTSVAAASITLTNTNLINVGDYAFYNVPGINYITADYLITIGNEAFRNNSLIAASFIRLTSGGSNAFTGNTQLNMINLGVIDTIGAGMLYGDSNIEQIFINNTSAGTTTINVSIGTDAFYNVGTAIGNRLRVYVPSGIASGSTTYVTLYKNTLPSALSPYVYSNGNLVGSYVHSILPYNIGEYMIKEVVVNSVTGWEIVDYHGADITAAYSMPTSFTVGATTYDVISVGTRAYIFAALTGGQVWDLVFPAAYAYIGDYAFSNRGMHSISGGTFTYIGSYAFENCDSLVTVEVTGVTTIGTYAFYMNDAMTTVSIGAGVATIGNYAFYHTSSVMTNFYINTMTPPTITSTTLRAVPLNVYVPYDAWQTYRTASIWSTYNVIRTQTAYLGIYLYNIINTNEVEITKFQGNNNSIVIPDYFVLDGVNHNVTSILAGTFDSAGQLRDITLPQYLKIIPEDLLGANTTVRNIYVTAGNTSYSSISGKLFDYSGEVLLRYPNDNTSTSYTLPTSTRVINAYAFGRVTRLTTLYMNSALTVVSQNAFYSSSIRTFRFTGTTPPYITTMTIFPTTTGLAIQVPTANLSTYQNKFTLYKYRSYISGY